MPVSVPPTPQPTPPRKLASTPLTPTLSQLRTPILHHRKPHQKPPTYYKCCFTIDDLFRILGTKEKPRQKSIKSSTNLNNKGGANSSRSLGSEVFQLYIADLKHFEQTAEIRGTPHNKVLPRVGENEIVDSVL